MSYTRAKIFPRPDLLRVRRILSLRLASSVDLYRSPCCPQSSRIAAISNGFVDSETAPCVYAQQVAQVPELSAVPGLCIISIDRGANTKRFDATRVLAHRWTFAAHIGHDLIMRSSMQSWRLFRWLAFAISITICCALPFTQFRSAHGTEFIILYSVRCALPFFILAFSASSLAVLWPSQGTRWLLYNRRYFGLAFAFAMGWHLTFVAYTTFRFGNPLNRVATALDLIGFAFLLALTLTSFRWFARWLGPAGWRRLHKTGVYVIWLLATDIYFAGARSDRDLFHAVALGILIFAWLLRVAAWTRLRLVRRNQTRDLKHGSAC
jgi:DMSO/TMAO reductase YedYZ heme-binding membrane subunit